MNLTTNLRPLAVALAMVALIGAGCSNAPDEDGNTDTGGSTASGGANKTTTTQNKAVKFAECMRDNGVSEFPDPDASGELTIDAVVNGTSLDPSTAEWKEAISACRDLQPSGFTGHKRSAGQQDSALEFAQCMRDNGVKDFPDPVPDGPIIDTNRIPSAAGRGALEIPGFQAATEKCRDLVRDALGDR